jgi:peptidoglycan-associated lipoprotein
MYNFKTQAIILSGLLVLTACGSTPSKEGSGTDGTQASTSAQTEAERAAAESQGADVGGGIVTYSLDDPASPLAKRVIYFAYDSSTIRDEDRELIEHHSRYLADHPETTVILEGHTDERGSREYNIALGERRAASVQKIMQLLGVIESQMQTISFGEERPVAPGHDEDAWQLNRRVEILYSQHR